MPEQTNKTDPGSAETAPVTINKQRRTMGIVIAVIIGALIVISLLVYVLQGILNRAEDGKRPGDETETYRFYPPYEGDILESPEYLSLNRTILYCADPAGYGYISSVSEESLDAFDARVRFLYEYLQIVIRGDNDLYRSLFTPQYLGAHKALPVFAQQMIYETKITFVASSSGQNGETFYQYKMEYMIHKNNGTFRDDVGSDASRPQIITLRVSADGIIRIDDLYSVYEYRK